MKAFLLVKDQTYQLAGGKETEGVLKLAASEEPAVLILVGRMLQLMLEVAVSALALALALAKSPQECQRLHCVSIVTGI